MVQFDKNQWSSSAGISGPFRQEYAISSESEDMHDQSHDFLNKQNYFYTLNNINTPHIVTSFFQSSANGNNQLSLMQPIFIEAEVLHLLLDVSNKKRNHDEIENDGYEEIIEPASKRPHLA